MVNQPVFEKSMANSLEIHGIRGKNKIIHGIFTDGGVKTVACLRGHLLSGHYRQLTSYGTLLTAEKLTGHHLVPNIVNFIILT